jgi:hypothetical protein
MSVRIFLSTVSDEFREYRDQLRSDLTRHNVEVKVQEDFKDYGVVTLEKLDLYISTCDAIVHLVGDMAGSDAKPASTTWVVEKYPDIAEKLPPLREPIEQSLGISYTQWEAWLALYHGKELLIAKADAAAPRGPNYAPTDASRSAQEAHLERLRAIERYPGCSFTSPDNLAKHILASAVLDLLAKGRGGQISLELLSAIGFMFLATVYILATLAVVEQLTKVIDPALAALISIVGSVGILALALRFQRYLGILSAGAEPPGSLERQDYDRLRDSLATGNLATRLYARWLTAFLDEVDRLVGDAETADRTLFPHAFGLKTPAPLWTAPAFDLCLLLALIYPIVAISLIWAVSGSVGFGDELGLTPELPVWRRGLVFAGLSFVILSGFVRRGGLIIGTTGLCLAVTGGTIIVAVTAALYIVFRAAFRHDVRRGVGAAAVAGAIGFTLCTLGFIVTLDTVSHLGSSIVAIGFGAVAMGFAFVASRKMRRWQGLFISMYLPSMIVLCLGVAALSSDSEIWSDPVALTLFLGLLPLLNAPFDWASLGLTRALLRRGLELGGWWPFLLGLMDAFLAVIIIAVLVVAMVLGVHAFEDLAKHGGGKQILPLDQLFNGIERNPTATEYWWVYALLLSSMIPSLINLMIGGVSLARDVPGLPHLLLRKMPIGKAIMKHDRVWIACVLTVQDVIGAMLGVGALLFLVYIMLFRIMPYGLELLDLARATFSLPMRLWQLFGGTL